MKETDLFKPVRDHFMGLGYEIFSEVETPFSGGRADIVAFAHPAAIAIELKTTLTIELIEQAVNRQNIFHYVYIAVPQRRQPIAFWLQAYLKEKGIGVLEVIPARKIGTIDIPSSVNLTARARYNRPRFQGRVNWFDHLKPEHKTWVEGGNSGGGHVTPYKLTMVGVRNYLYRARREDEKVKEERGTVNVADRDGWRSVKQILDFCETHYSTPKSSLARAMLEFEGGWVETKKERNRLWFRHKEVD